MPKFSWDAFLGGMAETGLEGFKTAAQASALKREADRRQAVSAFEMGSKIPIITGVGGLGGIAGQQRSAQAGLLPDTGGQLPNTSSEETDYSAYDTPGGIGAAPAPGPVSAAPSPGPMGGGTDSGPLSDAESRQAAGASGATAQARGPASAALTDEDVKRYLGKMDPKAAKDIMAGVDANQKAQTAEDIGARVHDMGDSLKRLRTFDDGSNAAKAVLAKNATIKQHLGSAVDMLYQQRENTQDAEGKQLIERKIAAIAQEVEKIDNMSTAVKKHIEGNVLAAEAAGREFERVRRSLIAMGADQDLIDNYVKVYRDQGDVNNAARMITIRAGQGLGMKGSKPRVTTPKSTYGTPTPLR
jgi:hypothetical protein